MSTFMRSDDITLLLIDHQSCLFQTVMNIDVHQLRTNARRFGQDGLEERGWVVGGTEGAAAKLGLPRTTLIYEIERFGICRPVVSEAALKSETWLTRCTNAETPIRACFGKIVQLTP